MSRLVPDDAVIAVDVGNHAYSFGRYFECTRQTILMSGYLGSIGFGFPAAMGAWAAAPERPILAVTGDGGFGQYLAELTTAVKYEMNITHVLLDNSSLGKISKEQRAGHFAVWQTSLHNPDFAEYARLCGAHGERVDDRGHLDDALARAPCARRPRARPRRHRPRARLNDRTSYLRSHTRPERSSPRAFVASGSPRGALLRVAMPVGGGWLRRHTGRGSGLRWVRRLGSTRAVSTLRGCR